MPVASYVIIIGYKHLSRWQDGELSSDDVVSVCVCVFMHSDNTIVSMFVWQANQLILSRRIIQWIFCQ